MSTLNYNNSNTPMNFHIILSRFLLSLIIIPEDLEDAFIYKTSERKLRVKFVIRVIFYDSINTYIIGFFAHIMWCHIDQRIRRPRFRATKPVRVQDADTTRPSRAGMRPDVTMPIQNIKRVRHKSRPETIVIKKSSSWKMKTMCVSQSSRITFRKKWNGHPRA